MKMNVFSCCLLFLFCWPTLSSAELVTYDFEEGSFGTHWANLSAGGQNHSLTFTGSFPLINGSHSLGPVPWGNRDQPHSLFHVQSEAFQLSSETGLTVLVKGGSAASSDPNLGTGSINGNVQGMTLTRVSDSERVLSLGFHTQIDWQFSPATLSWSQAQLAPFAAETGETWRLDLYDSYSGGFGWYSVDDITLSVVPEPSTAMTFGVLLAMVGLRPRRHC